MKRYLIVIVLALSPLILTAGEGMWIPSLLKSLNESEMRSLGMKMSADDIYSVNKSSLKDAIIHFGGFCTGEVISHKGLVLTNHHCGYGSIQSHSTVENNYLKNGFWASHTGQELPSPGLYATFIVRIEDVTEKALEGTEDITDKKELQSRIDKNLESIRNTTLREEYQDILIRPFFKGNQFYLFVTQTYTDVRLVGTPPENIGKFGSDTDNWVWPRHTGDFAIFRIYSNENDLPAEYSPNNKPLTPKHHLPVSLDGVQPGDFTLVFGFPGRTDEYLPATAVEQIISARNPARVQVREKALKILDSYMRKDPATRLKYASKYASIANYWKKWIGESQGIEKTNGIEKKRAFEADFLKKLEKSPSFSRKYKDVLPKLNELYTSIEEHQVAADYFSEVFGRNVELMRAASLANRLLLQYESQGEKGYLAYRDRLKGFFEGFYKDFDALVDKDIFGSLIELYLDSVAPELISKETRTMAMDLETMADEIYGMSHLTDYKKLGTVFAAPVEDAVKLLLADPAIIWYRQVQSDQISLVESKRSSVMDQINDLEKTYMKALLEVFPKRRFYPDANSTLRVTYGQVQGYEPRDAVIYEHVSYLEGVMEKYIPGDYEFDVSPKLIELYEDKDYGPYAENGKMPVCFIGTNHTTGGNSGSPAIDAHGNLIGLNFDRVWEGTMSDYNYDASICRNIMVDARYILFIIDKFAGAGHLVEEMDLVHPKKK